MSGNPGRHARWSVAALVAPLSAATFAGAISWSTVHGPAQAAAAPVVVAERSPSPIEQTAEPEDADHSVAVESLRAQVSDLTAQVAAAKATPAGRPARSTARTRTSAPTSRARTTARAGPPAGSTRTPPPVHTTTGASG